MKQEIGLKGIYRFLGTRLAKVLNRYFGVFNPNIITMVGFFIYVIGVGIFAIFCHKLTGSLILFIAGTQLSLVFDFADGSYARMVNRSTQFGHFLDSFLGTLRFVILLGIAYLIANNPSEKYAVVFLMLVYVLNQRVRMISRSQNVSQLTVRDKGSSVRPKIDMSSLLRFPFGFGSAHFYLYITLWFLFDFVYFLFVLYITGLFSIYSGVRFLLRQYPEMG
jgi:phosphatidylglycerophosphate synthase